MRRTLAVATTLLLALVGLAAPAAADWQPGTPPLTTPWTSQVSPTNALPDYPRPQLVRPDWVNLNGVCINGICAEGFSSNAAGPYASAVAGGMT